MVNVNVLKVVATHDYFKKQHFIITQLVFILISIFIDGMFAYIATIYVKIPINDAFDKAPARLHLIYDSLLLIFAGVITYWFFYFKKE